MSAAAGRVAATYTNYAVGVTDEELALSILRKMCEPFGEVYVDIGRDSVYIDGWVEKLTADEVALLKSLDEAARSIDAQRAPPS